MRVSSGAEEVDVALGAFGGALAEELYDFALSILARDVEVAGQAIFSRNGGEQVVDRVDADLAPAWFRDRIPI